MLHPSYSELMNSINSQQEEQIVNSRYSVVIAAARRARQLINGAQSEVEDYEFKKPLSVAVEELMEGSVKILSGGVNDEEEESSILTTADTFSISIDDEDEQDDYDFDEEDSEEDKEEL